MIKKVGYSFILAATLSAHALVPVEGILMGGAKEDIQSDPLAFIFRDLYDHSQEAENGKVKAYHHTYLSGNYLMESCGMYGPIAYGTPWHDKQAKRAVASTMQYIGLDTAIKAIGAYAKKLEVPEAEYRKLSSNLVRNYCSKNITIFSLRNIEQSLAHYYQRPEAGLIPSVETSPFATASFKSKTEAMAARSVEFEYAVKAFRSFCSWGGEVDDYRMMAPYLKNKFVMSFVIKNLLGLKDAMEKSEKKIMAAPSRATVQVACEDLICRKSTQEEFNKKFPLSMGSTGLGTDLAKLYCTHFRYQDRASSNAIPQVKRWIKESELEDPVLETSFFLSVMTGIPDPIFSAEKYVDLPFLAKTSIDERWNNWARDVLGTFSKGLLFEESLKVRLAPRRSVASLAADGFGVDLNVTLGELDRIMDGTDKLSLHFDLKLSKNFLRAQKVKWTLLMNEVDLEGQKRLKKDIAAYLDLQLKQKEKLFLQKVWNPELSALMANELLEQVLLYKGKIFDSYRDEVLTIPVRFNYGLFAMSYLRFRADVNADRLKFKL